MKYFLIIAILLLSFTATAQERNHLEISKFLYPETKEWTEIDSLPKINSDWFDSVKPFLLKAKTYPPYLKNQFVENVINHATTFFFFDINADGIADIIYTGYRMGAEGHASIIWYGAKSELNEWVVKNEFAEILDVKLLKVFTSKGKKTKISSVSIGCCSSVIDKYYIGYLFNPYNLKSLFLQKQLSFPSKMLGNQIIKEYDNEVILRSSHEEINNYDESMSDFRMYAVFGNIQRKYLPGVKAVTLSSLKIGIDTWDLIIVDESNDPLLHYSPYDVNVGWVKR